MELEKLIPHYLLLNVCESELNLLYSRRISCAFCFYVYSILSLYEKCQSSLCIPQNPHQTMEVNWCSFQTTMIAPLMFEFWSIANCRIWAAYAPPLFLHIVIVDLTFVELAAHPLGSSSSINIYFCHLISVIVEQSVIVRY